MTNIFDEFIYYGDEWRPPNKRQPENAHAGGQHDGHDHSLHSSSGCVQNKHANQPVSQTSKITEKKKKQKYFVTLLIHDECQMESVI